MRVKWFPREEGHVKLVVEPLNVLLSLRLTQGQWVAGCLGGYQDTGTADLGQAKSFAVRWLKGILLELMILVDEL